MHFEPGYFLRVFLIRLPVFLAVVVTVTALGLAVALNLPAKYQAQATLLVETSQIPVELAASTVRTDPHQQLLVIRERLVRSENLLQLAERLELYAEEPDLRIEEIASRTYRSISIQVRGGRGDPSVVVIGAEATDGATAAAIANDLSDQFLNADAEFRNDVAGGTLTFFRNEVQRLGEELDQMNRRILEFQNANLGALPETLDFRLNRQTLLNERITQARREVGQLEDQRARLVNVFELTGLTSSSDPRSLSPEEQELRELRGEFLRLSATFSDRHPRLRVLSARIAQLEQLVAGVDPESAEPTRSGAGVLEAQLVEIDSQIEERRKMVTTLQAEFQELQEAIDLTPGNSIALDSLRRDRDNTQQQYDDAVSRYSAAATGERIEVLSKGARLSVVQPAEIPTRPSKPNRKMIAAGAGLFGVFLGLGAILLLEFTRKRIRRPVEIKRALGITPLATFSYSRSPQEVAYNRAFVAGLAMLIAAAIGWPLLVADLDLARLQELAAVIRAKASL
ncbi:GumC family protein [Roseivivax sediminis]|uniref:Uncharacterized protein involved in exopolysaccharide biosynthesis n=1 Tax=Roseivivax sediminis TaxID=936889 RepID=A0A1I2DII5_9RHOB|nr:hypothetical protein [Roseivivax sediminis]SFE80287.1 Uncharacterized protein involved in exopolysaccharide biosynthesis [Roseivivax sediminis]